MSDQPKKPHALNDEQIANVRKWIEALRSGKFKQGKQALGAMVDGSLVHCCLGVGCEILNLTKYWDEDIILYGTGSALRDRCSAFLPPAAMQLLGIPRNGGYLTKPWRNRPSLYAANDDGISFSEIADFIARELETNEHGLFIREAA